MQTTDPKMQGTRAATEARPEPCADSLLRTLHAITEASRPDDVCAAVQRFVSEHGYASFAIGRDVDGPSWLGHPEIHTWPRELVNNYIRYRRVEADRGIAAIRAGAQSYAWRKPEIARCKIEETMVALLDEAKITGGLLVDIRGGVSRRSVFSLTTQRTQQPSALFIDACRMVGDAALLRLTLPTQRRPRHTLALSDRQLDVLMWAARGKSNRDIAAILDLTERNVTYHLSKVMAAIGVHSRSQAAAWLAQNAPDMLHDRRP